MRFVLLPDDEAQLVEAVVSEGLRLLANDVLVDGQPQIVADPIQALPDALPGPPRDGDRNVLYFVFWRPEWGVNTFPADDSPNGRVAQLLSVEEAERTGLDARDLMDWARTPVLVFRRCGWMGDGTLHPGALGGMARVTREQPAELATLIRASERRLMRAGMRLQSRHFSHTEHQPRTFALPSAMAWINEGGLVYPWDA